MGQVKISVGGKASRGSGEGVDNIEKLSSSAMPFTIAYPLILSTFRKALTLGQKFLSVLIPRKPINRHTINSQSRKETLVREITILIWQFP